jgi:hypothetical protein
MAAVTGDMVVTGAMVVIGVVAGGMAGGVGAARVGATVMVMAGLFITRGIDWLRRHLLLK